MIDYTSGHWSLDSISNLSPHSGDQGVEAESSNLITRLVPLATSLTLKLPKDLPVIPLTQSSEAIRGEGLEGLYLSGNSKSFSSSHVLLCKESGCGARRRMLRADWTHKPNSNFNVPYKPFYRFQTRKISGSAKSD